MSVLADTNILSDVIHADARWEGWAAARLCEFLADLLSTRIIETPSRHSQILAAKEQKRDRNRSAPITDKTSEVIPAFPASLEIACPIHCGICRWHVCMG